MERSIWIFVIIMTFTMSSILSAIFYETYSEYAKVLQLYQTLIGSVFATIAASFTAFVVYRSATLPLRAQAIQREEDKKEREQIYAALFFEALLEAMQPISRKDTLSRSFEHENKKEILPPILLDPNALETQKTEIAAMISRSALSLRTYYLGVKRMGALQAWNNEQMILEETGRTIEALEKIAKLDPNR